MPARFTMINCSEVDSDLLTANSLGMENFSENKRLFGVSGFIGRRWYLINGLIAYALGHSLLKAMGLFNVPAVFIYATIPVTIFYIYGLVYRRAIDILGGKQWRLLPAIVAVVILLPVADLILSGLMCFVPGKLSQQQHSTWRFKVEQIVAIVVTMALTAVVVIFEPAVSKSLKVEEIQNSSSSMEPSLKTDQDIRLLKDFDANSLKRGEIVVLNFRGKLTVRRIVGLAGDNIRFKGHSVWLNQKELSQSVPNNAAEILASLPDKNIEASNQENIKSLYEVRREALASSTYLILQRKENISAGFLTGELRIDPGMIWLLGDNRDNSLDSRTDGPVAISDVVGIVRPLDESHKSAR